ATRTSGTISQPSGSASSIVNQGTFNAQANSSINVPFVNASGATLNRSGAGTSGLTAALTGAGAVNVLGGTLDLSGNFTYSGHLDVSSGATLQFNGASVQALDSQS